jgi:Domain of unknown function (DUF2019)
MKQLTPDGLKSEFVTLCILQFDHYYSGKIADANRTFDKIYKLAVQIRHLPDKGAEFLLDMISHPHRNVRVKSAYLLLPLDAQRALKELKELTKSDLVEERIDADMCIQEWNAGRLDVDWFMKKYDKS